MGFGDTFGCQAHLSSTEQHALWYINLFGSIVGMMGASFVVVHFLLHSKGLVFSRLIFFISLADLGSSFFIFFSQSWLFSGHYPYSACLSLRTFIQFFVVSSFFWTACIAFYLFRAIVLDKDLFIKEGGSAYAGRQRCTRIMFLAFHTLSWGLPLIFCVTLLAGDMYSPSEGGWCHPLLPYHLIFWELPMLLVFVWNAVLYAVIFLFMHRRSRMAGRDHLSIKVQSRLTLFLLVYIVCWAPSLTSTLVVFINKNCALFWLLAAKNFLSPSQGFLNCLVYGLSNRQVRQQYNIWISLLLFVVSPFLVIPVMILSGLRMCGLLRHLPFSDESKRSRHSSGYLPPGSPYNYSPLTPVPDEVVVDQDT
ncbi:Slime mold cyclic amp receptor protein [Balamuthia mandrillaris]